MNVCVCEYMSWRWFLCADLSGHLCRLLTGSSRSALFPDQRLVNVRNDSCKQ